MIYCRVRIQGRLLALAAAVDGATIWTEFKLMLMKTISIRCRYRFRKLPQLLISNVMTMRWRLEFIFDP